MTQLSCVSACFAVGLTVVSTFSAFSQSGYTTCSGSPVWCAGGHTCTYACGPNGANLHPNAYNWSGVKGISSCDLKSDGSNNLWFVMTCKPSDGHRCVNSFDVGSNELGCVLRSTNSVTGS